MTLAARGVGVTLGGRMVLAGVDFTAVRGEVTCLVGKNGEGKTTLLRALCGISRPSSGAVELDGASLFAMTPRQRALQVGALFSAPDTTFGFTVRELVAMGRYPHLGRAFEGEADRRATDDAVNALELEDLAEAPIHTLSAGERQRVGLARLLCQSPTAYLFDEPTSNLDPNHVERFVRVARGLAQRGAIAVCVVHDLDLALRLADRLVVLDAGRVSADGTPGEVLSAELVRRVWGVEVARVDALAGRPALVVNALPPAPQAVPDAGG